MHKPIQITFQGNTLALFSGKFHWKSLTIDIWQSESTSWFGAGAGFSWHTPPTEQGSPLWCDYTYYLVIATSWSGIHSVIKKYYRITHGLCMKLVGEGEEHKRRLSNIFSWCRVNDSSRWNSVQQTTMINTLCLFKRTWGHGE